MNLNNLKSIPEKQGRTFSGYLVCLETGRIYSLKSNKWLKLSPTDENYLKVSLMDDDKKSYSTFAHRAVLAAKIGHWDYHECEHKDGNPANNCADNLEPLPDHKSQYDERVRRLIGDANSGEKHGNSIFTDAQVRDILIDYSNNKHSRYDFIKSKMSEYNCNYSPVYLIVTRRTWKHIVV